MRGDAAGAQTIYGLAMPSVWNRFAMRSGGLPTWLLWLLAASSTLNLASALLRAHNDPIAWAFAALSAILLVVVAASLLVKRQGKRGIDD